MSAHTPSTSLDLGALKRLADAATQGSWRWETESDPRGWIASVTGDAGDIVCDPPPEDSEQSRQKWRLNAAYIAAIDPQTLKALIARLEAAEAALQRGQMVREPEMREHPSWAPNRAGKAW
ncbi:MAG TPA: hypothetical protein VFH92_09200 [Phenylobacterium sp.]|nr:hypothetical protein [Phenylobacterium sp.]